ncbi:MAG: hypothetical protein WD851_12705 [Pirellulales bacterium]
MDAPRASLADPLASLADPLAKMADPLAKRDAPLARMTAPLAPLAYPLARVAGRLSWAVSPNVPAVVLRAAAGPIQRAPLAAPSAAVELPP